MKTLALIANSAAGNGFAYRALDRGRKTLWGWPLETIFPKSCEELEATCAGLDSEKYEAAVVLGGDGTVNRALRGLIKSQVPLYPFPLGTANDLAAEQGLRADWEQVQRLVDSQRYAKIDLIQVNDAPFATVGGIGVGAIITRLVNQRRKADWFRTLMKRARSEVYSLMSATTILFHPRLLHDVQIESPETSSGAFDEKLKTGAVFVCNQNFLGGNIQVSSRSRNNDQRFCVLIVPRQSRYGLLDALLELRSGKLNSRKRSGDFISFETNQLTVKSLSQKSIHVFGDGEVLTDSHTLDFKLIPNALRVYRGTPE